MKFLVIGAGAAGGIHVRELCGRGHEVCVYDVDADKAGALAASSGATPVRETSGDYGATVVAVPAGMRGGLVGDLLAEGRKVICEKPLAIDVAGAEALRDHADAGNLLVAESQCYAGADGLDIARMRGRLAAGEFGAEVLWRVCAMTNPVWVQSWCDDLYIGGGAFLEGGVHVLTTARVLFGEAVRWQGSVRCFSGGTGPDTGTFIIDYAGGDQLCLQIGWGTAGCADGTCEPLPNSAGLIGPQRCEPWWPGDDHAAMWGHLLKCLAGEAVPVATVADAAGAVADCWRCYGAAGVG